MSFLWQIIIYLFFSCFFLWQIIICLFFYHFRDNSSLAYFCLFFVTNHHLPDLSVEVLLRAGQVLPEHWGELVIMIQDVSLKSITPEPMLQVRQLCVDIDIESNLSRSWKCFNLRSKNIFPLGCCVNTILHCCPVLDARMVLKATCD